MNTFPDNLAKLRGNLERLEALYAAHPELFDGATDTLHLDTGKVTVYLHHNRTPEVDWRAMVRAVGGTGWKRENSVVNGRWDWRGMVAGVEVCVIGAEARPEPEALEVL